MNIYRHNILSASKQFSIQVNNMLKNTTQRFGTIAKTFHWLLFMMLIFSMVAGNFLADMPKGPDKLEAMGLHKSFGAVILMLISLRLFWRLMNVLPSLPQEMSKSQIFKAHAMHWVLYVFMFAQPVSGVMMSQASGYPVSFFGLFDFPTFLDKSPALAESFHTAHGIIWMVLGVAALGHIAAALYHHFMIKDDVLKKMTFGH